MEKNEMAELFKYCSPQSIMIITWYNKLKELYCPFNVQVANDIGDLKKGELVKVEAVKLSSSGITVFIIAKKAYYYYHFRILLH
ncbi:hypothetical protein [Mangrovimonas sp. TPBH4]|uniref:hypothetical protein n=1 Tax=Mangrovimonas sp. TPBH4 TaxID=1645914 RepID=UPI0006B63F60|nr:hypothetical protein [Mangrovimonas sp. TPBH4]